MRAGGDRARSAHHRGAAEPLAGKRALARPFGPFNTKEEVETTIKAVEEIAAKRN